MALWLLEEILIHTTEAQVQNCEQEFISCFSGKGTKLFSRLFIVGGGWGGKQQNNPVVTEFLLFTGLYT